MSKLKPISDEEDRAINEAIDSDPDTWSPSDEEFDKMVRGHPDRVLPNVKIDTDIIEHFRARGGDWRAAINDALRKLIDAA